MHAIRSSGLILDIKSHSDRDATCSVYNYTNASVAIDLMEKLVNLEGVEAQNITVITPYRAQTRVYHKAITALQKTSPGLQIKNITINTVDSLQGGEAQIVILDLCVTNKVGFMKYMNRINVATFRARDAMYILVDIKGLYAGKRPANRK